MNIWEAFDELDALDPLKEAFNGTYVSPYLNISDAERQAAQQKYEQGKNRLCTPTPDGMRPVAPKPSWYIYRPGDGDNEYFVLDYEAFHKAYDKELERAGLLTMFQANGVIGPPGCYGNIKDANLPKTDIAYKTAIELWAWQHGKDKESKRWKTISAQRAEQLVQVQKEQAERRKQYQAQKDAEEAQAKAATDAANAARDVLEDILPDALALVDSDLLDKLEEAGLGEVDIGRFKFDNLITIGSKTKVIPAKPVEEYTPEFLADFITEYLESLDLDTQVKRHYLGLDLAQKIKAEHGDAIVYWVHEGTGEIYIPASKFTQLVNKETKAIASPQDLSQCTLAFIKISNFGSKQTNSATEDVHHSHYYSYIEELVSNTDLQQLAPKKKSGFLYSQRLDYYRDTCPNWGSFYDYPEFDTWVHEQETEYGNG